MTTPTMTLSNESAAQALNLAKRTVCLHLSLGALGTKRKVDPRSVTDKADADRLGVSKDILRMPELDRINKLDAEIRPWLRKRSLQPEFLSGGYYLIATSMLDELDAKLKEFVEEREALVEAFYERYAEKRDEIIEEQRSKLRDVFDESEYPTAEEAREEFSVQQRYFAFDVPLALKAVSKDLYQREAAKQATMWAQAHDEITLALRVEFKKLVDHMADRLAVGEDGKPKVFRDTLVSNFSEFLGTFPFRNVTEDGELDALVKRARKVLQGATPDDLRDNASLRAAAEAAFTKMRSEVGRLVTDAPVRAISFDKEA